MKKVIIIIIAVVVVAVAAVGGYYLFKNSNNNEENNNTSENRENNNNENNTISGNSVVVYFSATGNTERVAGYIGEALDSEVIEITPSEEYTSEDLDYNDDNSRVVREHNDESSRPEIANEINVEDYDTIFIGYPIWWGEAPNIILTFLDNNDLTGKDIYLFATSASSGMDSSVEALRNYNENLTIVDGRRFSSSVAEDEVTSWLNELN